MERIGRNISVPWAVGGDFTAIAEASERWGSNVSGRLSLSEFADAIQNAGLSDAGFVGNRYTWSNNRAGNARIWAWLDRILVNDRWGAKFSNFRVEHLPRVNSDHAPLRISFPTQIQPFIRPFWFFRMWTLHDLFKQVKAVEDELVQVESRMQNSMSKDLFQESMAVRRKLAQLELMEEIFWKQKARNSWLEEGDRNTKLFLVTARERNRHAMIKSIKGEEGNTVTGQAQIQSETTQFFEKLFQAEQASQSIDFLSVISFILSS
ncbi:uncharacterized protein LOC131225104 [Magnolia sinica]|uniref:uncharacterized protein LOC131225104 n=1 Tax=Magnolia sinica TaxID=86752 RepID=UPI002658A95F|nr:uncharacterized protein LOC131225104 [Magnolia sinica]